jgi:GNAT superfamily N-acetyltransferase
MIRRATHSDIPGIEAALLKMKGRSEFRTVKVEFERGRKVLRQCMSSPRGFAAVAEHGGRVTGVIIGIVTNHWFSAERFASDFAFCSFRRGDGAQLLQMFKAWADSQNAILLMAQSSGVNAKRVRAFYESQGLTCVGNMFVGEKPIAVSVARRVG